MSWLCLLLLTATAAGQDHPAVFLRARGATPYSSSSSASSSFSPVTAAVAAAETKLSAAASVRLSSAGPDPAPRSTADAVLSDELAWSGSSALSGAPVAGSSSEPLAEGPTTNVLAMTTPPTSPIASPGMVTLATTTVPPSWTASLIPATPEAPAGESVATEATPVAPAGESVTTEATPLAAEAIPMAPAGPTPVATEATPVATDATPVAAEATPVAPAQPEFVENTTETTTTGTSTSTTTTTTTTKFNHRLRIRNGCQSEPVWIAHMAGKKPGPNRQNLRLAPGEFFDFATWDNLASTRFWPKFRCGADGNKCTIGDSGGPMQVCHNEGCAPPVDTKFEATFGRMGKPCDPRKGQNDGCDWVDVSLVDGFTVPFKFQITGDCFDDSGMHVPDSAKVVDCSNLTFEDCPAAEEVYLGPARLNMTMDLDLQVIHPRLNVVIGCYAPCSKLTLRQWGNHVARHRMPSDPDVGPYCCPTPPVSPEACRQGPIVRSKYVQGVHKMCPRVYGYSYDDGLGLLTCSAQSLYEVTFLCPQMHEVPAPSFEATLAEYQPQTCRVGASVPCFGGSPVCAGNECCPDGSPCPSAADDYRCQQPKKVSCLRRHNESLAKDCQVGDRVLCPDGGTMCAGNSCCPDQSTCPSAAESFQQCMKPKRVDCVRTVGPLAAEEFPRAHEEEIPSEAVPETTAGAGLST